MHVPSEPAEMKAWLEPYITDFYVAGGPGPAVEWHRVARELDACMP